MTFNHNENQSLQNSIHPRQSCKRNKGMEGSSSSVDSRLSISLPAAAAGVVAPLGTGGLEA